MYRYATGLLELILVLICVCVGGVGWRVNVYVHSAKYLHLENLALEKHHVGDNN